MWSRLEMDLIEVDQITPSIGAEISGVDLNRIDEKVSDAIYQALMKYKVIFFRDQDLTPENHINLARGWGELEPPHPIYPKLEGFEHIVVLKSGGESVPDTADWHTDMTFRENPPFCSILHQIVSPKTGGDTLWCSCAAAYAALSEGWKRDLEGLVAIHDIGSFRNDYYAKGGIKGVVEGLAETGSAVHPVVASHPITGEKYLTVNCSFTRNIIGLVQGESDRILQFLFRHLEKPEFQVRFRWRKNSVAIWDNRITQHYACCDYLPQQREMRRVTVLNDKRIPIDV